MNSTVAFVTVNYNNAAATGRLVRSLESLDLRDVELLVIDNASTESDRAILGAVVGSARMPIRVIWGEHNHGFAAGSNAGLRLAYQQGADWAVLINNDTVAETGFGRIREVLGAMPPSVVALPLAERGVTVTAGLIRWLRWTLPHLTSGSTNARIYAIGGGMALHRSVFEALGPLDERYFLYFEDADYCERARQRGIPVLTADIPALRHEVSATTSRLGSPLLLRYHARNAILFNTKNAPVYVKCLVPIWVIAAACRQVGKLLIGRHRDASRAILAGIRDALARRWGKIDTRHIIAIECESLEDAWGVSRAIRGLLNGLADNPRFPERYRLRLYFRARIPTLPDLPRDSVACIRAPWLFARSFSLYYYLYLPVRLWIDRPAATYWPNYMLPLLAPSPSIVMLTEDVLAAVHEPSLALRYRIAYRIFAGWSLRHADRIMAISASSAVALRPRVRDPERRLFVNHLAVSALQPASPPMHGRYLLYAAQGFPRRHLRETVLAFAQLAVRYPDVRLLAIGSDKYDPPVIAQLVARVNRELGRDAVVWKQRVSDAELAGAMRAAQALVYVSDLEAFGLPPLEAASVGVVPIVRDLPVHRELLGASAVYVPSADPGVIAAALERALNDTTLRMSVRQAAHGVTSRYTWKAHADRWLDVVQHVI